MVLERDISEATSVKHTHKRKKGLAMRFENKTVAHCVAYGKPAERGVAIIETALVLPLLLFFLLGIIEYGLYFYKEQAVQRTLNATANAIQRNLGVSSGSVAIRDAALYSGLGVVNYGYGGGGYVCANAYASQAAAAAADCKGSWYIIPPYSKNPSGLDYKTGDPPYYVKVTAHAEYKPVTSLLGDYIPSGITASTVVQVGAVMKVAKRVWRSYPPTTGLRASATVYKNDTSSDAVISISMRGKNNGCMLYIGPSCGINPSGWGNSNCALVANCVDGAGSVCLVAGTVPPGNTYVVHDRLIGCGYNNWAELSTAPLN